MRLFFLIQRGIKMAEPYGPKLPSGAGAGQAPEPERFVREAAPERPVQDVVKDIVGNVQEIVRSEIRLARTELRDKASAGSKAAAMIAAGGVLALYALGFLFVAIYVALDAVLWAWLSALIVFVVLGLIGGGLYMAGKSRLRSIRPVPERTVLTAKETVKTVTSNAQDTAKTVKEEVQWTRNRVR